MVGLATTWLIADGEDFKQVEGSRKDTNEGDSIGKKIKVSMSESGCSVLISAWMPT